jgi:hypothetical protein
MNIRITIAGLIAALLLVAGLSIDMENSLARGDGFNDAVKTIEQFYHVKHQSIPFLARVGMAEAGSVRVAFFEDQNFDSRGQIASFKASMQAALTGSWSPLVQTLAPKDEEQTYIYIRDAGEKFHVLVVTIERHEATVIQATIAPEVLAQLMKDPQDMGKALTEDATINDH